MGMGTRTVGTGWGWGQSLWGRGGDGGQVCGDGVGMGKGTTGTVGDGDELLSPCSSLVPTDLESQRMEEVKVIRKSQNFIGGEKKRHVLAD